MANTISTGGGIALGAKLPRDTASVGIMERAFDRDYKRRKDQEAKALATLDDFNIDYTKWLPAWGKEAAKIQSGLVNKFNEYLSQDPRTAANKIQLDAIQAKQQIGNLWSGNENAKERYLKLQSDPKFYYEGEVGNALIDPKLSLTEVYEKVKPYQTKGIVMTPDGGFSFAAVEKGDYSPYTKFDKYEEIEEEVKSDVPYTKKFNITRVAPKEQVEARVQSLASDPVFQKETTLYKATDAEKKFLIENPDQADEFIVKKAREIIEPFSTIREAPRRVSYPSGTSSSETKVPTIAIEPSITEYHKYNVPSSKPNKDGTVSTEPSEDEAPMTSLGGISFSTPQTAIVTVSEYYDPKDQKMHKGTAGVRKINFQSVRAYNASNRDIKDSKLEGGIAKQKGAIWMDKWAETAKKNKNSSVQLYVPVLKSAVSDGSGGDEGETVYVPLKNVESGLKLNANERAIFNQRKNELLGGAQQEEVPKNKKTKDFISLPINKKQELQKQSGTKTRADFEQWLIDNGYSF